MGSVSLQAALIFQLHPCPQKGSPLAPGVASPKGGPPPVGAEARGRLETPRRGAQAPVGHLPLVLGNPMLHGEGEAGDLNWDGVQCQGPDSPGPRAALIIVFLEPTTCQ